MSSLGTLASREGGGKHFAPGAGGGAPRDGHRGPSSDLSALLLHVTSTGGPLFLGCVRKQSNKKLSWVTSFLAVISFPDAPVP